MRIAALCLIALFCCGCGTREAPVVAGPVATPVASQGVSSSTETLIAGKANAEIAGDHKTAKALDHAIQDQGKAEIVGGNQRLITLGILLAAMGIGLMVYGLAKLGAMVAAVGGSIVGGALFVTSIVPYLGWIALGGSLLGVGALFWSLHNHRAAVAHLVSGGSAFTAKAKGVSALISKAYDHARGQASDLGRRLAHFGHLPSMGDTKPLPSVTTFAGKPGQVMTTSGWVDTSTAASTPGAGTTIVSDHAGTPIK